MRGMTEFLKMDVFFVIATVGFVLLALLLGIAVFYIIQLLRTLNRVADTIEEEAMELKGDLDAARASMKRKGSSLFKFAGMVGKRLLSKKR
jgi:hypothetical protein